MKALLISSKNRTVTEIDAASPYRHYKEMIGGGTVEGVSINPNHLLYVDDHGRDYQATYGGFQIAGVNVVGDGVLCARTASGYDAPAQFTAVEVAAQINWYDVGAVPPATICFHSFDDLDEAFSFLAAKRHPGLYHLP